MKDLKVASKEVAFRFEDSKEGEIAYHFSHWGDKVTDDTMIELAAESGPEELRISFRRLQYLAKAIELFSATL